MKRVLRWLAEPARLQGVLGERVPHQHGALGINMQQRLLVTGRWRADGGEGPKRGRAGGRRSRG